MSLVKKQMVVLLCFVLFVAFLFFANRYITQLQGPLSPRHAAAFSDYKKNFGSLMGLPGVQAGENSIKLTVNKSKGAFGLGVITSFQDPGKYLTIPSQYSKPMRVQKDGYWVEFTPAFSQKINNVTAEVLKSTIIYPGILPDVDIVQHVMPYGIKEDIVIKGKDAPTFYQWKMALDPRLTARLEHNYVSFYKKGSLLPKETASASAGTNFTETKMFEIAPPFLMDTKGNKYFQAYTALNNNIYTLSIEKKWLEKLNSYPLVLDPTILHNSSANFATGTHNRSWDEGSGAAPLLATSYHELAADINTVGLWHLNEASGNAVDSSGNGNTGTPTGTTVVAGKFGNARSFNGTSDIIQTADSVSLSLTNKMTVEFWANQSALTAPKTMVGKWQHSTQDTWIIQHETSGQLSFVIANALTDGGANYGNTPAGSWTIGWHHVSMVYDGSGSTNGDKLKAYIDGVPQILTFVGTIPSSLTDSTAPIMIGQLQNVGRYWNGEIDELRISNIARTPEEIKQDAQRFPYSVYTSPVVDLTAASGWTNLTWLAKGVRTGDGETPISTTNLVAQWNFNDTPSTATAVSGGSCGTSCNGTLTNFANTTAYDAVAGSGWTANNKRWGAGALMFDGGNDVVNIGDTGTLKNQNFTISAWINPNSVTGNHDVVVQNKLTQYANLYTSGSTFKFYSASLSPTNLGTFGIISIGQWTHLAVTKSGTTVTFFQNGVQVGSGTQTGTIGYDTSGWSISNDLAEQFSGVIDAVQVYSRALTTSEILANYQAGNIEFQTRTSADNSTWEAWKPTSPTSGVDTAIDSMDISGERWKTDDNQNSSSTIYKATAPNTGTGVDGDCIVNNGTKTLDSDAGSSVCNGSARSTAYAVNFSDTTLEKTGETSVTVSSTPTGLTAGDEIIIINLKGTSTIFASVGQYETHIISSIVTNDLNFTDYPLRYTYDGTTQKIVIQRVPNFGNVTICGGNTGGGCTAAAIFTSSTWNGTKGGVLSFRSNATITINSGGTITTTDKGYITSTNRDVGSESYCGISGGSATPGCGGGAGGSSAYGNGGTTGQTGGAGGSTGFGYAGGGGAGYGSVGIGGTGNSGGGNGANGNGSIGGNGGNNAGGTNTGGGGGGGMYGTSSLDTLYLGSAGGCGSNYCGKNGGGIVYIIGNTISSSGSVTSNGSSAINDDWGPGGGGAGGSIRLEGNVISLSTTTATGGLGGTGARSNGGNGGSGRVALYYSTSLTGTSSPVAFSQKIQSSVKSEGSGALQMSLGAPQVDGNTVALWHMDEASGTGAYIKDSTANVNHGTPTGTTVVDGFYGKGRYFDGTGDYISVPDSSNWAFGSGDFVVEFWIKTSGNVLYDEIIGQSSWADIPVWANHSWDFEFDGSNHIVFIISDSGYQLLTSTTAFTDNKWHHIVGVRNGSNLNLYVDGISEANTTTTKTLNDVAYELRIGADAYNGGNEFTGYLDEIRIRKGAGMSAEEIAEAYRAGRDHRISRSISSTDLSGKTKLPFYFASDRPGTFMEATIGESAYANYEPDANTVGLWHLEEAAGSGAYIKDSSGNGNNLTKSGSPIIVQGKVGKGYYTSAPGSYYLCSDVNSDGACDNNANLNSSANMTFDAWVKIGSYGNHIDVANKYSGASGYEFYLNYITGAPAFWQNGNSSCDGGAIPLNTWTNIAMTLTTSTTATFYTNGAKVSTCTMGTGTSTTTVPFTSLSSGGGGGGGTATIDELRVSNIVRTPDEIRQAYEIGKRTHTITNDFVTSPQAAYSSGTSVTINNPYGTTALTSTLAVGDTIIFKENVGGTETVSQATVTSVTNTSTTYGTVVVASAPTFPSGGFSTNAKVFKWQREYFDLTSSLTSHRDAVTRLTYRITDGSQGANVWLDDIRSNSSYLSSLSPSSYDTATGIGTYTNTGITSTLNRYFQYRAINSSWDTAVAPSLTSVSLNYLSNTSPGTPTISAPTNGATSVAIAPAITLSATDGQSDYLRYKIQIATDNGFTTGLQTFDQTASQTGWSGQNAQTSTAYLSGSPATYTAQANLVYNQLYYIRAYSIDPGGSNTWSTSSTTGTFTTIPLPAPTNCQISATVVTGPAIVTWTDNLNIEDNYYIESSLNGGAWSAATTLAANTITSSQTVATGTYQYRVRASAGGVYTSYCTTSAVVFPLESMRFEGVRMEGVQIK